jgi:hypothetical protein
MGLRRYQRNLIRLAVALLLALLALLVVLLFYPVSSPWLGRRIAHRLEQITGLNVTFGNAVVLLAQQRCVIKDMTLRSQDGHEVLTVRAIEISFSLPSMLFGKEKILHSVQIESPSALPVVLSEGSVRLGEGLDFLPTIFAASARAKNKPSVALEQLRIRNASIFLESSLAPSRKPQVIFDNINVEYETTPSGDRAVAINGIIPVLNGSRVRASYARAAQDSQANFSVTLSEASAAIPLMKDSVASVACKQFTINGMLEQDGEQSRVTVLGKMLEPLLSLRELTPLFSEEHLDLSIHATFNPLSDEIIFKEAHFRSGDLDIRTSGSIALTRPLSYRLSARAERLPVTAMVQLIAQVPHLESAVDMSHATVRLTASIQGQLGKDTFPTFGAEVNVLGAQVQYPDIREQFRQVQGKFEVDNRTITFTNVSAKFDGGDATLSGQLTGKRVFWEPETLDINWQASLRAEDIFAALPAERLGSLVRAEITGRVCGQGSIHNVFPVSSAGISSALSTSGVLELGEVTLAHPWLPAPIERLRGTLRFKNDRLEFADIRGELGQGEIALTGELVGKQLFWKPDRLDVNWEALLRAEDILRAARAHQLRPLRQTDVTGNIQGSGTLRKLFSLPSFPPTQDIFTSGTVKLVDIEVDHPSLPFPVKNLHGQINIENDHISFSALEGRMGESTLLASGSIVGNELFWINPQLDTRIISATRADTLLALAKRLTVGQQVRARITGNAIVDARLRAPLTTLSPLSVRAKADFKECYVDLDRPAVHAPLKTIEGAAETLGSTVMLSDVRGMVGDVPFSLDGWVTPEGARLNLNTEIVLDSLKSLLPTVFDKFRVGGSATMAAEIDIATNPNKPPKSRISAEIQTHDVTFAYKDMPVDVTHINGTLSFGGNELRILNARCWCGRSKDSTVNGTVFFAPGQTIVDFHVRNPVLYLDEWTQNWPEKKYEIADGSTETLSDALTTAQVLGSIESEKVRYGYLEGNKFQGSFDYRFYPRAPNMFYFGNVQASAYQGKVAGSGSILFPQADDNIYEAKEEVSQIDLRQLLEAFHEKKQTTVGRLSGTIGLVGQGKDINTMCGNGRFTVKDSRFIDNMIFSALGRVLRSPIFNDISFTQVEGDFALKDGAVHFTELDFRNPMLQMQARGKVGFDRNLDLDLYLAFLSAYLGRNIPLFKYITAIIE